MSLPDALREFTRRVDPHSTLHVWQDAYHDLHNDLEKEQVLQAVITWMNARLLP
ncbi:MAG: hypothetical protein ACM3QS_09820 [Bacteroidota bacterium]